MSKETITIDGQTYIKQGAQADTSPSKEELEKFEAYRSELQSKSWKLTFKTLAACWTLSIFGGADLFINTIFTSLFLFLPLYVIIGLVIYPPDKTKFSKEVWDTITPQHQPRDNDCPYTPGTSHYYFRNRNN